MVLVIGNAGGCIRLAGSFLDSEHPFEMPPKRWLNVPNFQIEEVRGRSEGNLLRVVDMPIWKPLCKSRPSEKGLCQVPSVQSSWNEIHLTVPKIHQSFFLCGIYLWGEFFLGFPRDGEHLTLEHHLIILGWNIFLGHSRKPLHLSAEFV